MIRSPRFLFRPSARRALAYAWHAFIQTPAVGSAGTSFRIGNAIFAAALILLLLVAARRTASALNASHPTAAAT
jgi:hypothetical protein